MPSRRCPSPGPGLTSSKSRPVARSRGNGSSGVCREASATVQSSGARSTRAETMSSAPWLLTRCRSSSTMIAGSPRPSMDRISSRTRCACVRPLDFASLISASCSDGSIRSSANARSASNTAGSLSRSSSVIQAVWARVELRPDPQERRLPVAWAGDDAHDVGAGPLDTSKEPDPWDRVQVRLRKGEARGGRPGASASRIRAVRSSPIARRRSPGHARMLLRLEPPLMGRRGRDRVFIPTGRAPNHSIRVMLPLSHRDRLGSDRGQV